jgi:chaperone required for assembly of F1-ATPase
MRRFWKEVAVQEEERGFCVALDGRPIKTQGGAPQIVPSRPLADALAEEWRAQGEKVDPRGFPMRDMADLAIDWMAPDGEAQIATLMRYAETDTLCYRADPEEPLFRRQQDLWEPLVKQAEASHGVRFERVSGIVHRPQPAATLAALRALLEQQGDFTLAALATMVPLGASLIVALAALEEDADPAELFAAANCEEDWQAELWGADAEAAQARAAREAALVLAARFAQLARA